jgi:nitroreductase
MDTFECIRTKLDVREYSPKTVPPEIKAKILEAARLTGSGMNRQHWRFILVQDKGRLKSLADDSTTGQWVAGANFAIVILTDPSLGIHRFDAGRALQDMQLAAWNFGVASRPFTGVKPEEFKKDFGIPDGLSVSAVLGFGYPAHRILGRKTRLPIENLAFLETYGAPLAPELKIGGRSASGAGSS